MSAVEDDTVPQPANHLRREHLVEQCLASEIGDTNEVWNNLFGVVRDENLLAYSSVAHVRWVAYATERILKACEVARLVAPDRDATFSAPGSTSWPVRRSSTFSSLVRQHSSIAWSLTPETFVASVRTRGARAEGARERSIKMSFPTVP